MSRKSPRKKFSRPKFHNSRATYGIEQLERRLPPGDVVLQMLFAPLWSVGAPALEANLLDPAGHASGDHHVQIPRGDARPVTAAVDPAVPTSTALRQIAPVPLATQAEPTPNGDLSNSPQARPAQAAFLGSLVEIASISSPSTGQDETERSPQVDPLELIDSIAATRHHNSLQMNQMNGSIRFAPPRAAPTAPTAPNDHPKPPALDGIVGGLPVHFIENQGQWDPSIRFLAQTPSMSAGFTTGGIQLLLGGERPTSLGLSFEDASPDVRIRGEGGLAATFNFIFGSDPARWHTNVASYQSIIYQDLYDGVDLRVREHQGRLEYDVILDAGARLDQVAFRADGALGLELAEDGALVLETAAGELRQTPPVTWEVLSSGQQRPVAAHFKILDESHFGFVAPQRDPSLPMVVDPGLDWGTFFGGNGDDRFNGMALTRDGSGDIIIAGTSQSADFPRTGGKAGVLDYGTFLAVEWTPYVARMNATGTSLVYATFFGGSSVDSVQDVAVNAAGEAVVVGDTNSTDFPVTAGAFDTVPGNGSGDYDGYVIKFNSAGNGVVFGTYLAGSPGVAAEVVMHAEYDPTGSVIVSGIAGAGTGFPLTTGAYPGQPGMFVSRFNPAGSQLTYSAFVGEAMPYAMAVDSLGFVLLTGQTSVATFPTTADAFQRTYQGNRDGYVARLKLDGAGTADLKYSTYLGGAQYLESINAVAVDPNNPELVTVGGFTRSSDFPTTPGAYQRVHPVPVDGSVAVVARFRFPAAGSGSLLWSTMFGAPGNQNATAVVIDSSGAPIIVGSTAANNPITTERSYDRTPGKHHAYGPYDAFAARLSADGSSLLYSTLLGGSTGDVILDAAYAGSTSIIVGGQTNSPDFPVSAGAFDSVYAADGKQSGNATLGSLAFDAFLARLTLEANATTDLTPPPAPTLAWPPDGSTYTSPTLAIPFDWSDVSDASGIAAYHLQISPNSTFTNDINAELRGWFEPWLPNSLVAKGFSVGQNGTWYWRVQTLDRAGNLGPWSAVRTVNIVEAPISPAPTLSSPPNNGRFAPGDIIFDWQHVAGAKYYQLQVDTRSDFTSSNRILVSYLTQHQHKLRLTTETKYWWRVRLANEVTVGPWSSAWSFELKNGSPAAPVPPPPSSSSSSTAPFTLTPGELWLLPSGQMTVTLASPAPSGGAVVSLESTDPNQVTVPSSVTVPAGSTSASFTVSRGPNPPLNSFGGGVVATYGGAVQAAWVHLFPDDRVVDINSLTINPPVVIGGSTTQGTAALLYTLTAGANGTVITLASGNPAAASVPASVTIPAGANNMTFNITTQPVSAPTWVPILASRGFTLASRLTLLPVGSAVSALSVSPTSVSGGTSAQGTVTLNFTAPAGGIVVGLSSSNTSAATVPASVTVPSGASSANFNISTKSVSSSTSVSITATMAGTSASGSITVTAPTGPLAAPTLMFPADKAKFSPGQSVTFMWSEVTGAASYTLQVDDSNNFSAPLVVNQNVAGTNQTTISNLPTGKFWWRVRAHDAAGNPGAWSSSRELEVKN